MNLNNNKSVFETYRYRTWEKQTILFVTAYSPMFLIFVLVILNSLIENNIQNQIELTLYFLFVFGIPIFIVLCLLALRGMLDDAKHTTKEQYTFISRKNITGDSLSYIVPYFLPIIGFQNISSLMIIAFIILFGIIYLIYIKSDLLSINPILIIMNYRIYCLENAFCQFVYSNHFSVVYWNFFFF